MENVVDGIKVIVIRKKIKNMYIRIASDCSAVVTVPLFVSEKSVERFLYDNIDGVKRAIGRKKEIRGYDYFTDGYIYVFGEKKTFEIKDGKSGIVESDDKIIFYTRDSDRTRADKAVSKFLKEKLTVCLDGLISYWESVTGLKSSGYTVKLMRTRWGSCNCSTKKLNFSLYLADMPKICVSYVVLHEICHIRYADHGAGFKAMLTHYMPKWKKIKKYLNGECEKMRFLDI